MEFHSRPLGTSAACGKGLGPRGLSSPRPLSPTQPSVYLAVMNGGGFGDGLGGARRVLRADGAGEGAAASGRAAGLCPSLPRPRSSAPAKRALLRAVGHGAGPGPPHGAQGPGGALRLRAAPRDGYFLGRSRPGGDEASCRVSTQRSLLLDPPPHLLHTTGHLWPVWKDWPVAGPQAKVRAACSPGTRGLRSPACAPGRCEALQSTCPGPCSQPPRTFPTWGLRRCPQAPVTPPGPRSSAV